MDYSQEKIIAYIRYLKNTYNLEISIHFKKKYSYVPLNPAAHQLSEYNNHANPYCLYVKNILGMQKKCLLCQTAAIRKCGHSDSRIGTCHAGVREYIHPISVHGENVGILCVSGYRGEPLQCRAPEAMQHLKKDPVPLDFLEVVIPPLTLMVSTLIKHLPPPLAQNTIYTEITNYLNHHYNQVTLEQLSTELNYSKSAISHLFKRESGQSIRRYCNQLKINDAKRLLLETNMSITEIALCVGFNNFSYFIKTFKQLTSKTPSEWRKQRRK